MATLLAAYSFDGQDGADASGNGHTLVDSTASHISYVTGHGGVGYAVQGDGSTATGTGGYGETSSTSWLTSAVGDQITVMGWATINTTGTSRPMISTGNIGSWTENFGLWPITTNMNVLLPHTSSGTHPSQSITLPTGWVHWAAVYDSVAQTVALFQNGVSVSSLPWTADSVLSFPSARFSVAATLIGSQCRVLDGAVDDVRVYHGALTASQITTCMGVSVATTPDPLASGGTTYGLATTTAATSGGSDGITAILGMASTTPAVSSTSDAITRVPRVLGLATTTTATSGTTDSIDLISGPRTYSLTSTTQATSTAADTLTLLARMAASTAAVTGVTDAISLIHAPVTYGLATTTAAVTATSDAISVHGAHDGQPVTHPVLTLTTTAGVLALDPVDRTLELT